MAAQARGGDRRGAAGWRHARGGPALPRRRGAGWLRQSAMTGHVLGSDEPGGVEPAGCGAGESRPGLISYTTIGVVVQTGGCCTIGDVSDSPVLTVSNARAQLAAIIDRVRAEHQPIYLSRRGRRVAAVIDADDLDRMMALAEDMADIRAAQQARDEVKATAATPIPWEDVKAELGLV